MGERFPVGLESLRDLRATSAYWITPYLSSDIALNGDTNNERPVQILQNPLCANLGPACGINPKAFPPR
jgi:hypothetical protein